MIHSATRFVTKNGLELDGPQGNPVPSGERIESLLADGWRVVEKIPTGAGTVVYLHLADLAWSTGPLPWSTDRG